MQADFKESTMEIYAHGGVGFVLDILTVCSHVHKRRGARMVLFGMRLLQQYHFRGIKAQCHLARA